jgi:hypothetical protein
VSPTDLSVAPRRSGIGEPLPMLLLCLTLSVYAGQSLASPGIGIVFPAHGTELTQTSAFYDPALDTVQVQAMVTGIPPGTGGDYRVLVNGFAAGAAGGSGGSFQFSLNLPIGPQPPLGLGFWPPWVPYVHHFTDTEAILLPVLVELVHTPSWTVVSRDRIVLFDKRWDDDLTSSATGSLGRSLAFELSASGLNALEGPHTSSLPQPSLARFNEDLADAFAGTLRSHLPDIDYGSEDKVCIGLESVPAFTQTSAYGSALGVAQVNHAIYEQAESECEEGDVSDVTVILGPVGGGVKLVQTLSACALKQMHCVREEPREDRFEVCVGGIEGLGTDLAIAGVSDVYLELSDLGTIDASNLLGRVDGEVDVTLRDFLIRWDVEHAGCVFRPQAEVSEDDRIAIQEIAEWSACPALEADAYWAESNRFTTCWRCPHGQAHTPVLAANPETLTVDAAIAPDPLYELSETHPMDVGTGTCGLDFVSADVETLLEAFYDPMREALDDTWDAGNPRTQQADALDLLLSRFETGGFEAMPDVRLDLALQPIVLGEEEDRLQGFYNSDAEILPEEKLFRQDTYVYSPPQGFPCTPDLGSPVTGGCDDRLDFFGNPFDVSYSTTTGMLNQVIRERYGTERLFRELAPSCEAIGQPVGCAPDDRPVLDGNTLSTLSSALADLGDTEVVISMNPTLVPFTWIHPDPPGLPPPPFGRANLTYQLGQYQVDFIGSKPGPDGTDLWLRLIVDFFAPAAQLEVARAPDSNAIVPELGDELVWYATIVKSQLSACPLVPKTQLPPNFTPSPCEGDLTTALQGLVEPVLEDALHGLLTGHPAPQMFDAFGEAPDTRRFEQTDRMQWRQVITFFGSLEP